MTILERLRFFPCTLALLAMCPPILLAAQPEGEATGKTETIPRFRIVPGVGVGGVEFGMSSEAPEVKELTRSTHSRSDPPLTGDPILPSFSVSRDKDGNVVWLRIGNFLEERFIRPGVFKFKTEKGIGLGAGKDEVILAYGMPETKETLSRRGNHGRGGLTNFDVWRYPKLGMFLAFHNDRLVDIRLRPAETNPANKVEKNND